MSYIEKYALNRVNGKCQFIEVSIRQGLNRQVRRMLAGIDMPVKSLKRTKIGKLVDRGLGVGKSRKLTNAEIAYLKKITNS